MLYATHFDVYKQKRAFCNFFFLVPSFLLLLLLLFSFLSSSFLYFSTYPVFFLLFVPALPSLCFSFDSRFDGRQEQSLHDRFPLFYLSPLFQMAI